MKNGRDSVGVLVSGGLDSCILMAELIAQGKSVQPFYIDTDVAWRDAELQAVGRFLTALQLAATPRLVTLRLPLSDLYQDHWSIHGQQVPDADSSDESVFLPGRNALLVIKAAVWCQIHGISQLALAPLGSSPFADAQPPFFAALEEMLHCSGPRVRLLTPFAHLDKAGVLRRGNGLPLHETFSCLAPDDGLHCGRCNKCNERRAVFRDTELSDPTLYAAGIQAASD